MKKALFTQVLLIISMLFISKVFAYTPEITNGLDYLTSIQNMDGSWDSNITDTLPATTAVIETYQVLGETTSQNYTDAVSWLQSEAIDTTDYLSERVRVLRAGGADLDMILSYLDSIYTGAWGGYEDYESNILDTTLALQALKAVDYTDFDTISYALGYLINNQNPDGGFGFYSGDESNVYMTAVVLKTLSSYNNTFDLQAEIDDAVAYLLTTQNPDGSFGEGTVYETAVALDALIASDADPLTGSGQAIQNAIDYLLTNQLTNGSWNDDPYSTALALRALSNVKPNLSITNADITFSNPAPTVGDTITITATIHNTGIAQVEGVLVQFYDGDPEGGGILIGETTIPSIPAYGSTEASIDWTSSISDIHNIFVIIDPLDSISEDNETDNIAIGQIKVYEKIDLTIQSITFTPELPSPGQTVDALVKVANMGGMGAGNVIVRLYMDGGLIGEQTITTIGSLQSQTLIFTLQNLSSGLHEITATVDPDNTIIEGDETNNSLTDSIEIKERVDLIASNSGIYFSNSNPKEGETIYIAALIFNGREGVANNVLVRLFDGDPNTGGTQIGTDQVIPTITGGGTGQTEWIPYNTFGKYGRHTVYVFIDPLDTIEETNEMNNMAISDFTVEGRTDLIVQEIRFTPSAPEEGDIVQIKAVVKNIGTLKSSNTQLKFYLGDPSAGGEQIGTDRNISDIAPDATYITGNISFSTTDKLGDNEIYAVVDPFNTVDEINETNNTLMSILTVSESTRPDLTLTSSDITFDPEKPVLGDLITISAQIRNLKNIDASNVEVNFFDGDPASGGVLIGNSLIPDITGGGTGVAEITWDAGGVAGLHKIYVKIDPSNTIDESNETNNEASTTLKIRLPQSAAPQNLTATPINDTDIELNWEPGPEAVAYGIVGYNIYRNNVWVNSLKDISKEGIVSASSSYSSSYSPDKAVDGNVSSFWLTERNAPLPQWWEEDFDTPRKIKKVAIYWHNISYARDFKIQTWDGTGWITQSITTGNSSEITTHDFPVSVITDKIRIFITAGNNPSYPAKIMEIDIYEDRLIEGLSYQDTGLGAGTYTYYATAVDANGVESLPSNEATASLGDTTPPAPPTGLIASVSGFDVNLTWNANTEPDLSGYRLYRNDLNVARKGRGMIIGNNGYSYDNVIDGDTKSTGYTKWVTSPPGRMTIILSRVYEINKLRVLLYEGNDNRFYRYMIESSVDGEDWQIVVDKTSGEWRGIQEEIFNPPIQAQYFRITGTFCSKDDYFRVAEFEAYTPELARLTLDNISNISVKVTNYSNFYEYTYYRNYNSRKPRKFVFSEFNTEEKDILYIYDKDTGILLASYSGNLGTFVTPPLTAANYKFQFITDYEGSASGFQINRIISFGKETRRNYNETIYKNGDYYYAVTAIDTGWNESDLSDIVTVSISDTTPPATPQNLIAVAGDSIIQLSWTENTEPDLAGYNLYRNGDIAPLNGDTLITANSYEDLDVNNFTTYTYQITAVDVNGNESPMSAPVIAMPTGVDLTIRQTDNAVDIFIFPLKPSIFDTAAISALIRNMGTDTINNVKVDFYDGDPDAGGVLIGSDLITEDILPGGSGIAMVEWILENAGGLHTIYAVVDPDNNIAELDETNNIAFKELTVATESLMTVYINSINIDNFPMIKTELSVMDSDNNGISGLDEDNFVVNENSTDASPITVTPLSVTDMEIPKVDIVFVIDTSSSMDREWETVCSSINDIVNLLLEHKIDVDYTIYGLRNRFAQWDCATVLKQVIYNGTLKTAHFEDWGPGTTWVALNYPWREGATRIIIPMSDENAYAGYPETDKDLYSIQEAIEACVLNHVTVYPFYSTYDITYHPCGLFCEGVMEEAEALAQGTGGAAFLFEDSAQVINEIIKIAMKVSSNYIITYTSPNPARDGTLRDVEVKATYGVASGTGTGQYKAPLDAGVDLAVKSLTLSNNVPLSGETVTVTAEIQNIGGLETNNVLVRFYDGDPSSGVQIGNDQIISNISPAEIITLTTQWLATSGTHDIYVVIDPLNDVAETNEDNNIAYKTVTVPGSELPELSIHKNDITFSKINPVMGETITINTTIHNTGADATDILVQTYLGDPMNGGEQIGSTTIASLLSNDTTTIQTQCSIDKPAGNYDIYIWIDPYDSIPEGNEDNNIAFRTITIHEKEITIDVTTDNTQYQANSDVGITVLVENHSVNPWSGTGEVYIEDLSGNQVDHVATFAIDDLKPFGISGWAYRIPVPVTATWNMEDTLAQVDIDFVQILSSLGISDKMVDKDSIRVLEFDMNGGFIGEKQARTTFNTDTIAEVIWLMEGTTLTGTTRYFYIYFDTTDNGSKEPSLNTKIPGTGRLIAFSDERGNIYITENNGDGTFGAPAKIDDVSGSISDRTRGIALDDFNNDGFLDIVTGSGTNGEIYYYQNRADGSDTFEAKMVIGSIVASGYIMDMAVADFNDDGNRDFVVSGNSKNILYLFTGNGDGTFIQTVLPVPSGTNYFKGKDATDVDRDGNMDLIVGNSYGRIYLYQGNGDGTFAMPVQIGDVGSNPFGLVAGDFDEDGDIDIIANNDGSGDSYLIRGNGDGTFEPPSIIVSLDTNSRTAFDTGDFNNDGHLDVIAATYSGKTIDFYPGNGDGTFGSRTTISTNSYYTLGISSSPALPEVYPALGTPELMPSMSFDFIWNTGNTPADNYKVHVTLSEGQGVIAEDYTLFEILPDLSIDSQIVTDKASYSANETVTINSTITNISENFTFEGLDAKVTVSDSNGAQLYSETNTISMLALGQLTELITHWNTGQSPPGTYTVTLNGIYNGQILSTSTATFEITDTPVVGSGIVGSIDVSPSSLEAGEVVTLNYSVTNIGNSDITDMDVQVLVVNPETGEVLYTFEHLTSLQINTTATYIDEYMTEGLEAGSYMAVLQAVIGSETLSLDSETFEVLTPAGPEIEVSKAVPDVANLLVWVNEKKCEDEEVKAKSKEDEDEEHDKDDDKECIRLDLLEEILDQASMSYYIVHEKKDFQEELRNPYYTDFLIIGDHHHLEDHFYEELREQVYFGKGVISSLWMKQGEGHEGHQKGKKHEEDDKYDPVFGVRFKGHLSGDEHEVELLDSPVSSAGTLNAKGGAIRVEAEGETVIGGWIKEADERHPAMVLNKYGRGKAVYYAFDLAQTLNDDNYTVMSELIGNSISYVHTANTDATYSNQLIPVEIMIKSLGGAFDLRITETYPAEIRIFDPSTLLGTGPYTGEWITDNPWVMDIHLEPDETKTILYYALTPDMAGTYTLQTEVGYIENNTYNFYQNLSVDISVNRDTATLADDILVALEALAVSEEDEDKVNHAIEHIDKIREREVESEKDAKKNIHDIVKAVNSLLSVEDTDISDVRLMMDELLMMWEARYYFRLF
jgi:subtilase family serine protease